MFLYKGAWPEPTPEIGAAWQAWFSEIEDNIVDSGNPFGPGREVTGTDATTLAFDGETIAGYTIVNAEDMEQAEKLLTNCPMITSVLIYEAINM